MSEITDYACGFLFWRGDVLLVRKNRPPWQAGLLNGVGGHVEGGEALVDAVVREFREETGLETHTSAGVGSPCWRDFARESAPTYRVHFYRAAVLDSELRPTVPKKNDRGETLLWVDFLTLLRDPTPNWPMVGNLRWLLPLALDWRMPRVDIFVSADITTQPIW